MPIYLNLKFIFKQCCFCCIIICCLKINVQAQASYGITAGVGKSSLYKFPFSPVDFNTYTGAASWRVGLTANFPIIKNNIDVLVSPTYSNKGYTYAIQYQRGLNNAVKDSGFSQNIKYIDLNIALRKKFTFGENNSNSFFIGAGPVVSFFTGGTEKITLDYIGGLIAPKNNTNSKLVTGDAPGNYKQQFFSAGFSLGFQIKRLTIWGSANIPLNDYYTDVQQSVLHKIKTFDFNVAYNIITHNKKDKEAKPVKEKRVKEKHKIIPIAKDSLADADGDGIADINDKCPHVKGTAKYFGCPIPDTDGDGVNDEEDQCITVPGPASNHGCPVKQNAIKKDTVCFTVYFEPGKSILRTEAYNTLSAVVKLLKDNPKLVAVFSGNTDNVGSVEANYKRSLDRANVCQAYVQSFYIDNARVSIFSYGNTRPAADLTDPLLQWKNRRVEVCLFEK